MCKPCCRSSPDQITGNTDTEARGAMIVSEVIQLIPGPTVPEVSRINAASSSSFVLQHAHKQNLL